MKFDLRKPCDNCPFRTNYNFPLDQERVAEIIGSITTHQETFACHKTTLFDGDGECVRHDNEQHCAGAMIMLEHMERPNQMMRIAERCGFYDRTKLDMGQPVFKSGIDMLSAPHWLSRGATTRKLIRASAAEVRTARCSPQTEMKLLEAPRLQHAKFGTARAIKETAS